MAFNPMKFDQIFVPPIRISPVSAWVGHIPFAQAAVQMLKPRTIVELGTHAGDSYLAFCRTVQNLKLGTRCYAVDTWEGEPHSGLYGPDVLAELRRFHDPAFGSFSELVQARFDSARTRFKDGSIDLLHIDGLHTYEAVKHDFDNWLPAMSDRGVILLHDVCVREVGFGVWKLWEELAAKYPHLRFDHSYGLGVIATGNDISEDFKDCLSDPDNVRMFFQLASARPLEIQQRLKVSNWVIWIQKQLDLLYKKSGHVQLPQRLDLSNVMNDPARVLSNTAIEIGNVFGNPTRANPIDILQSMPSIRPIA